MSEQADLDEFGVFLIRRVRDKVLDRFEMLLDGRLKGDDAARLRQVMGGVDEETVRALAREAVDATLHCLLSSAEEDERIQLLLNRTDVRVVSDGLAGELYGDHGWVTQFSKHPRDS